MLAKVSEDDFKLIDKDQLYLKNADSIMKGTDLLYLYRFDLAKYNLNSDYYITLRDGFVYEAESALVSDEKIEFFTKYGYPKQPFFNTIFYKSPAWVIPKEKIKANSYFYLKVYPHRANNRMEFFIEDQNTFFKRIELEYLYIGVYVSLLFSIIVVLLLFSILKKEYSIIFFTGYIVCALISYLSMRGIAFQFVWGDYEALSTNYSGFFSLGFLFLGLFYLKFYSFNKETILAKKTFQFSVLVLSVLVVLNILNILFDFYKQVHLHAWYVLRVVLFVFTILHIYLAYKKVLPKYLSVIFVLTLVTLVFFHNINPSVLISDFYKYALYNARHILFLVEVFAITRFIFSEVIDVQVRYTRLQQANEDLKGDFQKSVFEIQAKERNALLSDVHDSFGGYLETVKMRLIQENASEKLQDVVNSFYGEYRMLLNNIYSPSIDHKNFSKLIRQYCDKVDKINKERITCSIELEGVTLSQDTCMHLYRIVSEGITNAIKHAKSSLIHLHISFNDNEIKLELADNGIGIDYSKNIAGSYGLNSMKNRVEEMKGELILDSRKNKGTHLIIKAPLN